MKKWCLQTCHEDKACVAQWGTPQCRPAVTYHRSLARYSTKPLRAMHFNTGALTGFSIAHEKQKEWPLWHLTLPHTASPSQHLEKEGEKGEDNWEGVQWCLSAGGLAAGRSGLRGTGEWEAGSNARAPPGWCLGHWSWGTCWGLRKSGSWAPGTFGCGRPSASVAGWRESEKVRGGNTWSHKLNMNNQHHPEFGTMHLLNYLFMHMDTHTKQLATTHYSLDDLVLAINLLDSQDVVAEVESLKSPLLAQEDNHAAASPVEALTKQLPARKHTTQWTFITSSNIQPLVLHTH